MQAVVPGSSEGPWNKATGLSSRGSTYLEDEARKGPREAEGAELRSCEGAARRAAVGSDHSLNKSLLQLTSDALTWSWHPPASHAAPWLDNHSPWFPSVLI